MPQSKALLAIVNKDFKELLQSTIDQIDEEFTDGYALKNPQLVSTIISAKARMYSAHIISNK